MIRSWRPLTRICFTPSGARRGIDVSAYRLVQEALTNALKHGSGTVDLTVDSTADALRIAVRKTGLEPFEACIAG